MKTVYKYQLPKTDPKAVFQMPRGAFFRFLDIQNERITLWFEVETDRPLEPRNIQAFGTGEQLPEGVLWFCGSIQLFGRVVLHVYEIRETKIDASKLLNKKISEKL